MSRKLAVRIVVLLIFCAALFSAGVYIGSMRVGSRATGLIQSPAGGSEGFEAYWLDSAGLAIVGRRDAYVILLTDLRNPVVYSASSADLFTLGSGLFSISLPLRIVESGVEPAGDWDAKVVSSGEYISFTTMYGDRITVRYWR